jgi:flagellar protein FlaG
MATNNVNLNHAARVADLSVKRTPPETTDVKKHTADQAHNEVEPQQLELNLTPPPEEVRAAEAVNRNVEEHKAVEIVDVEAAVGKLQEFVQSMQRDLQFSIDTESGKTVVTVIDSNTKEVLRQVPSEEVLRLAQNLEQHQGALLQELV